MSRRSRGVCIGTPLGASDRGTRSYRQAHAAGVGNFRKMLEHVEQNAPLRRNVNIEEVGNVAAFLCSDLASGVTGEIVFVDAGFNIMGITGI